MGWYTLRSSNGKALTVANSSTENGADILIADYNGSNSQKFRIFDDGNENMAVLSAVSGCKAGLDARTQVQISASGNTGAVTVRSLYSKLQRIQFQSLFILMYIL